MTKTATLDMRDLRGPTRRSALNLSLRARLRIGTALAGIALPLGLPGLAMAADECGAPIGGVVNCTAAGNPYAGGITYNAGGQDFTLNLSADAEVRSSTSATGVSVSSYGGDLKLNLDGGIVTNGAGVYADSSGDSVTVNVNSINSTGDGLSTYGRDGSTTINAGSIESGRVGITALSNDGSIAIDVHSLSTTGGVGIDAFSNGRGMIEINSDGQLSTTADLSSGIVAQTNGNVVIDVNKVTTLGRHSQGILVVTDDFGLIDISAASVSTAGIESHAINARALAAGGAIVIDAGSVTTLGDGSIGINAKSVDGSINITSGGASTAGQDAIAIRTETSTGAITIENTGPISTRGDASHGILALSTGGAISVTNKGSITTTGIGADAVQAVSTTGAVTVANTGTISTTGVLSRGMLASSTHGAASVTNSGTITTVGDNSAGIIAESITNNATVTNSGSITTTGARSDAIWATSDRGDVTVVNSGTAAATGNGSSGVYASSNLGNVTVISTGSASASGDMSAGVLAQSGAGNVLIDVVSASGAGIRGNAVSGFSATGNVVAKVGTASTNGEAYVVSLASQTGDLSLVAGDLTSRGDVAIGVSTATDTGRTDLKVKSVTTMGMESTAIAAESDTGAIAIDVSGPITTSGNLSDGIAVTSTTGAVTINALGPIVTTGRDGDGINVETDNDVTISTSEISTAGRSADGILASSGSGKLTVVSNGMVTTTGDRSEGIDLSSTSGDIDVVAGSVTASGEDSGAIEANSGSGSVRVVSTGTVSTLGVESTGIHASGGAGSTVNAATVSTLGEDSIAIQAMADTGDVRVSALDVLASGDGSDGIVAYSAGGSATVTARNSIAHANAISAISRAKDVNVTVSGTAASTASDAIVVDSATSSTVTIRSTARVHGAASAIVANGPVVTIDNAGFISAGTGPTLIATGGTASLTNSGTFVGSVRFDAGNDVIGNSGTFALSGLSEFGGGSDRFSNAGIVNLLASATLKDLERFDNAGLITLANNRAGEVLAISGDYVGNNGHLVLDVDAASGTVTHDQLVLGGTASGSTTIVLNSLRGGALLPGRTLTLVDAAGGSAAGAFTLSPESVNTGFSHYGLRYDATGDDFVITAAEGLGLFQTLKINEGAQALWRQSADAWSARTASLRDPAKNAEEQGRLWAQFYSSADERDQTYAASAGDFDISYRQKHVGGQFGVDLGQIGGLTYGLTGGYLASGLRFTGTEDRTDYDAFNLGAYAQGQWGNYFVNALAKYDMFGARIDSVTGGFTEKLDGKAYGLQLEAGARFGTANLFFEPVASLAYSRTDLDTLAALGATVDFANADSLRGKVGARVGGTATLPSGIATYYLGAHLVNEFQGEGGARLDTGSLTSSLVNDPVGPYGQLQLGATLTAGNGLTSFVEGTASAGSGYQNYGGRLGLRLAF